VNLPDGTMAIIAPEESRASPTARAFLDRVLNGRNACEPCTTYPSMDR